MRLSTWNAVRILTTLSSVVLLGIWVNLYTNRLSGDNYWKTLIDLGWSNLLFPGGTAALIASEYFTRRRQTLEHAYYEGRLELLRQRQVGLLKSTLRIVCELISKTLRIPCNARYFNAVVDDDGEAHLEQNRDLAVLNIRMPREFGFTRVSVNTPHIVSGRAYRERCPVYEDLPDDHHSWYDARVARMIEPRQRWVLACPVLALDPETNRHDDQHPPHGVIVFYGVHSIPASGRQDRIDTCLDYAQQFADQMSQLLSMLDLTRGMAVSHEHHPEPVS